MNKSQSMGTSDLFTTGGEPCDVESGTRRVTPDPVPFHVRSMRLKDIEAHEVGHGRLCMPIETH